jgi:pantoate--beta-alanine ligase
MLLIKDIKTLKKHLSSYTDAGKTIGFVPTMGALHDGHISLVQKAITENDISVCSIFVNPTQFNNKKDYNKYPITLDADIAKLEKAGCDILFIPTVEEMYPCGQNNLYYALGSLETILEGKYRPGHFQGVCMIVDKLLAAVMPKVLYLGRKDYQQCMVIGKMMELRQYKIRLDICDTVREKEGLAMSSRNMRLNEVERKQALRIIESLMFIKNKMLLFFLKTTDIE